MLLQSINHKKLQHGNRTHYVLIPIIVTHDISILCQTPIIPCIPNHGDTIHDNLIEIAWHDPLYPCMYTVEYISHHHPIMIFDQHFLIFNNSIIVYGLSS